MTPLALFWYVLMVGLALACVFVVSLACWVLYLSVKGWLIAEPAVESTSVPRPKRRLAWPFAGKAQ